MSAASGDAGVLPGGAPPPHGTSPGHPRGGEPLGRGEAAADARISRAVFALLVLACFAAFLITQRLKHSPTAVQEFKRTNVVVPGSTGALAEERIAFKIDKPDEVTVTIEDTSGNRVATLVRDLSIPAYKILSLRWNGREGTAHGYTSIRRADGYTTLVPHLRGPIAPAGEYRVRVALLRQKLSVGSTDDFTLVKR